MSLFSRINYFVLLNPPNVLTQNCLDQILFGKKNNNYINYDSNNNEAYSAVICGTLTDIHVSGPP